MRTDMFNGISIHLPLTYWSMSAVHEVCPIVGKAHHMVEKNGNHGRETWNALESQDIPLG